MPTIDYFYKKLDRLGSKIGTSLRGKISKRDLLILSFISIGIFVVSVYFGGVIGAFTFVLAAATIWNGKITQNLLKQSKEASRQTRQAFEIDTFNKIVSSASQLNAELRATKNFPQNERPDYVKNFAAGMLITVKYIDPIMFEKISKAIEAWFERDSRTPATTFLEALNKTKD